MTARKSTFVPLLMIGGAWLIVLGCGSKKEDSAINIRHPDNRAPQVRDVPPRQRVPRYYGKLRLPAEIFVDLLRPERAGDPAAIAISASSQIPATSGVLTLRLPNIGEEPARTEILWTGAPSDLISETKRYVLPPLPVGKYHFVGILEFTPDREDADKLLLSDSLYLDVRADRILSSNVSFRQIERHELYAELEQRVLKSLNPGLATADPDAMARFHELIETVNPGLIKSKIAELRATDPDVARRIMELNSSKAQAGSIPETPGD